MRSSIDASIHIHVHIQMEVGHWTHWIPGFVCCHNQSRLIVLSIAMLTSHLAFPCNSGCGVLGHQCLQEWFLLDWRAGPFDGPLRGIPGTSSLSADDAAHGHVMIHLAAETDSKEWQIERERRLGMDRVEATLLKSRIVEDI